MNKCSIYNPILFYQNIIVYDVCSGYMAPEYAIDGNYSIKSDVFSLGILMLEIVSGKKNRGVYHPCHDNLNLIGQVSINLLISSLPN